MIRHNCPRRSLLIVGIVAFTLAMASVASAKETITYFNFFHDQSSDATEQEIIRLFEEKHPEIDVEKLAQRGAASVWEKATVMAAGGTPPDVVVVSVAAGLGARRSGLLLDLTAYVERDGFDMSRFRPGYELTIGPDWAWENKIYGMPFGLGIQNIFYNRGMFREAGLAEPYKGWTKSEYLDAAKRMTKDTNGDGEPNVWGTTPPSAYWNPWPFIDGGDFADPETGELTLNDPRLIESLEFIRDVVNSGVTKHRGNFLQGEVGMSHAWDSYITSLLATGGDLEWSVTWAPRSEALDMPVSYGQGHVMSIMKDSEHVDAAWEFVKFYYSDEAKGVGSIVPLPYDQGGNAGCC